MRLGGDTGGIAPRSKRRVYTHLVNYERHPRGGLRGDKKKGKYFTFCLPAHHHGNAPLRLPVLDSRKTPSGEPIKG